MKYMIGYQLQESGALMREILNRREQVYEVYFAWGSMASGRGETVFHSTLMPHEAQMRQFLDLKQLAENGIGLNLLLNANCYGRDSLSRSFLSQTGDLIDYLRAELGLASVTTTSPVLAHFIRENFEGLEIRASVNMEIGTVEGMEYLADDFDGFYYRRELNRNLPQVAKLKSWCDSHEKRLYMLANSGCLNYCSARQFHDNLVAHEREIGQMDNGAVFKTACGKFVKQPENRKKILRYLNCVRPEEMALFEPYVTAAKLATRVSPRPENTVRAYLNGSYGGNLLELLEPSHAGAFYPTIVDNSKLPADFSRHTAYCDKNCDTCVYCDRALIGAGVTLDNGGILDVNECND